MPSAVVQETVTSLVDTASSEIVNSPMAPSATVMSSMDTAGVALASEIVASPVASSSVALTGLLRVTVKVSLDSSSPSVVVCTEIVPLRSPAAMVSDWPDCAV